MPTALDYIRENIAAEAFVVAAVEKMGGEEATPGIFRECVEVFEEKGVRAKYKEVDVGKRLK